MDRHELEHKVEWEYIFVTVSEKTRHIDIFFTKIYIQIVLCTCTSSTIIELTLLQI